MTTSDIEYFALEHSSEASNNADGVLQARLVDTAPKADIGHPDWSCAFVRT